VTDDVALLGAYRPGASWLHRLPATTKLLGLLGLGLALALVPGRFGWVAGSTALLLVVAAAASARLPLGASARALRGVLAVAVAAAAYQWWRSGWEQAVGVLTTLAALVIAGLVVTATTPMDDLVDVVVRGSRPLARLGLRPEWVGLAVALTLRGIPALLAVAAQSRDAARARGQERNPRALLVPTVVRAVGRARRTGEAIAARGLTD
jgi:biotin transport system permease protein